MQGAETRMHNRKPLVCTGLRMPSSWHGPARSLSLSFMAIAVAFEPAHWYLNRVQLLAQVWVPADYSSLQKGL